MDTEIFLGILLFSLKPSVPCSYHIFETESHIAQTDLELVCSEDDLGSSCRHLPSSGIIGMFLHAKLKVSLFP